MYMPEMWLTVCIMYAYAYAVAFFPGHFYFPMWSGYEVSMWPGYEAWVCGLGMRCGYEVWV